LIVDNNNDDGNIDEYTMENVEDYIRL